MSKIAVSGNASGTGTFTIQSPATNTDRVLTLPDEAGTVLTSASDYLSSTDDIRDQAYSTTPVLKARLNTVGAYNATNSAYTKCPFDTVDVDSLGAFNNTGSTTTLNGISVPSYSYAPNVAGYYLVTGSLGAFSMAANTGRFIIAPFKNNAWAKEIWCYEDIDGVTMSQSGSSIMYLNGTSDYIDLRLNHSNGADRPFDYDSYCRLQVTLIRSGAEV